MRYKTIIKLQHVSGTVVTITCESATAALTAHVANNVKAVYGQSSVLKQEFREDRQAWDFLRDLFNLPRQRDNS